MVGACLRLLFLSNRMLTHLLPPPLTAFNTTIPLVDWSFIIIIADCLLPPSSRPVSLSSLPHRPPLHHYRISALKLPLYGQNILQHCYSRQRPTQLDRRMPYRLHCLSIGQTHDTLPFPMICLTGSHAIDDLYHRQYPSSSNLRRLPSPSGSLQASINKLTIGLRT
ncbi:hypothetical protein Lser_V15G46132 [Lactuca serriola]